MQNDDFVKQTAKDYDLDIDIVRSIYQKYPNSFYEKLEEFLRELK
jgi:hypothetical protein